MIFKTFESDIDKISAKWGVFGKSFNEIGTAITGRISDINKGFQATDDLLGAFGDTDSIWKRLYPSKESIKSQIIDVDALIPKIDVNNFDFGSWINRLNEVDKKVKANKLSWQDFSDSLDESQKWIAKWGEETQGQIRTQEGLVKANQQVRETALAHNAALKQQTIGAKATTLALEGLKIAANMLATWAISELITGLYKLTQVSKDVAASAEEIGSAFNTTSSDLKDYEEKVEELNNTINNSSSSITEVTEARKQLLSVQNEMIEKYGTEQDSIDAITQAIHGNKNAWKELTKLKWQDAVNEFNKSGFVNDLSNSLHGYKNNLQRMQKEYGEYTATISFGAIHGHEAREQAKLLLSSFEGYSENESGLGGIDLSGTATEVYDKILKIQSILGESGVDFGNVFDDTLIDLANSAKEVSVQYKDFWNDFVLNEKIFKDTEHGYANTFNTIAEKYEQYQNAVYSNDGTKRKQKKPKPPQTLLPSRPLPAMPLPSPP